MFGGGGNAVDDDEVLARRLHDDEKLARRIQERDDGTRADARLARKMQSRRSCGGIPVDDFGRRRSVVDLAADSDDDGAADGSRGDAALARRLQVEADADARRLQTENDAAADGSRDDAALARRLQAEADADARRLQDDAALARRLQTKRAGPSPAKKKARGPLREIQHAPASAADKRAFAAARARAAPPPPRPGRSLAHLLLGGDAPRREVVDGVEGPFGGAAAAAAPPRGAASSRVGPRELADFARDGYVVLAGAVPSAAAAAAGALVRSRAVPGAATGPDAKLTNVPGLEADPRVLALYGVQLRGAVGALLGDHTPPRKAQVAVRFPDGTGRPPRPVGGRRWHVDGFRKGEHSAFDLLVGVCLSDVADLDAGNLAVHPGAHATLAGAVRRAARAGKVRDLHYDKEDLGEPTQLRLRVGDVVLAHQKLPHLGVPNHSAAPRLMVYFRLMNKRAVPYDLRHAANSPLLDDVLLPFAAAARARPAAGRRLGAL